MTLSELAVFDELLTYVRETSLLQTTADLLEWDERTGMPVQGGEYRARQVTLLRGMIHERRTSATLGKWLAQLQDAFAADESTSPRRSAIARMREDFERDCRLPRTLVESLATATVRGQQAWERARREDDFSLFRGELAEILRLKREAALCLAKEGESLYDALLGEYEPGARVAELAPVFASLRQHLVELIGKIGGVPKHQAPKIECLRREYPIETQRSFSRLVAEAVGFDFRRGRLDETTHPFCTSLGPDDCRILTRYQSHWFPSGLFGTLHEAGHGIYEQGLPRAWYGCPPGTYASLGIHESQSRLWENLVGRSLGFWNYFFPLLQQSFPQSLGNVSCEQFHAAVNAVEPSLIRVEADEATYNLHIIVRFEIEQELLAGELLVEDLPAAWNARYREVLGIEPPSDARGVLQDVHWSAGLIGYFPTYTLGNIYAAQLFQAAERELGTLEEMFSEGEFSPLLQWLRTQIHQHGRSYDAAELIARACGERPNSEPLVASLNARYGRVYSL